MTTQSQDVNRPTGMAAFTLIWFGQVGSLLGSAMTQFAMTIWAYQVTGQATALALVGVFTFGPMVLMSPFAGALVDRWNRKLVMMLSDLAAGISTIIVLLLYASGNLEVWHLYVTGALTGVFQAFQWPAYSAAITTMLPKSQYTRASGMLSLAQSISQVAAPVLAGLLIAAIGIGGVLVIDIVTFSLAVGILLFMHIPQPETTDEQKQEGRGSIFTEAAFGFRYIKQRPSLLGLQLVFFAINFTATMGLILLAPMILARTDNNELIFGTVQSFAGIGGIVGGVLLAVWGGPKRRVHGVLLGMIGSSLLGQVTMGIGQNVIVWAVAGFSISVFIPTINGSNQAIWQAKVPPHLQGRVFSVRLLIAQITAPLAMLIAGPMADFVFEPAMMPGGVLEPAFAWLVGTGPGAGMKLIFVLSGLGGVLAALFAYTVPAIRNAEDILPDHDNVGQAPITQPAVATSTDPISTDELPAAPAPLET